MKKTAITVLLAAATFSAANAQTAEDAFRLSENNYEGTARSIALGNAVTALGGDLGAVTINPAGNAVANYSQITLTPGLSFNTTTSQGIRPWSDSNDLPFFQKINRTTRSAFRIPNIGFSLNWDTKRTRGLKGISIGFISNMTNSWNEDVLASGTNELTSYQGSIAVAAAGITSDRLMAEDAFYDVPWNTAIGYYTGMINALDDKTYIAATEQLLEDGSITMPGEIKQKFGMTRKGSKNDYIFNLGFNISDLVYIGANLGINSASYSYNQYIKESAVNTEDFKIVMTDSEGKELVSYFNDMTYKNSYRLSSTGIYGKFGVIVTPYNGLRLGAAIQTPTFTSVKETFNEYGETSFSGPDGGKFNESSPDGENSYVLRSPFRANFGAAFTFGRLALVSVDYEFCDYGRMKYKRSTFSFEDDYDYINQSISEIYGACHQFRLGGEIKPIDRLAIRAGYNLVSAPERNPRQNNIPVLLSQSVSFGLGFSSRGSFFADAAVKYDITKGYSLKIYEDYIGEYDNQGQFIPDVNLPSPSIRVKCSPLKAVLTLGWRF